MPAYLIIRLADTGGPRDAVITQFVADAATEEAAAKQGYAGDARYAVLPWDARVELDLGPGEIEVRAPTNTARTSPATTAAVDPAVQTTRAAKTK